MRGSIAVALATGLLAVSPTPASAVTGPAKVVFGSTYVGNSTTRTVTFTAQPPAGATEEQVQGLVRWGVRNDEPDTFTVLEDECSNRPVAGTCDVTIKYMPVSTGLKTLELRLTGASGMATVALVANGHSAPLFSGVYGASFGASPQDVTLANDSDGPLELGTVQLIGADPSSFAIDADECSGKTIEPLGFCVVRVSMVRPPQTCEQADAKLRAPTTDAAVALLVPVSGPRPAYCISPCCGSTVSGTEKYLVFEGLQVKVGRVRPGIVTLFLYSQQRADFSLTITQRSRTIRRVATRRIAPQTKTTLTIRGAFKRGQTYDVNVLATLAGRSDVKDEDTPKTYFRVPR